MRVKQVDPRDATWEVLRPAHRVYFWSADGAVSDEREVAGADADEVIRWAEANRNGRDYSLYVRVDVDGIGLVRLMGTDPNTHAPQSW